MSSHPKFPGYEFPEVGDKFTQDATCESGYGAIAYFDNLEVVHVHQGANGHLFIRFECHHTDPSKRCFGGELHGYSTENEWVGQSKHFNRKKLETK